MRTLAWGRRAGMWPSLRESSFSPYQSSLLPSGYLVITFSANRPGAKSMQWADVCIQLPSPHFSVPPTQPLSSQDKQPGPSGPGGVGGDRKGRLSSTNRAACWRLPQGCGCTHCRGHREWGGLPTSSFPCPLLVDLLCRSPAHSFQNKGRTGGGLCSQFST